MVAIDGNEFVLDLLYERLDGRLIYVNDGLVDDGAAVGKVDRLDEGLVVGHCEEFDPVLSVRGRVTTAGVISAWVPFGELAEVLTGMGHCPSDCQYSVDRFRQTH